MTLNNESAFLKAQEDTLSEYLEARRDEALNRFIEVLGREVSLHSFHAYIGKNNNLFLDSIRSQFSSPEEFIGTWVKGFQLHLIAYAEKRKWAREKKEQRKLY